MKSNYSIRAPQEKDAQAISDFAAIIFLEADGIPTSYTKRHLSPRYFQWKYFQSPIHRSCVRIAEDGDVLIGTVASTFKRLRVGQADSLCAEIGDLFTHPQYRRRGIFTTLTRKVCEQVEVDGAKIIYSRPNENSYPGLCKLGFENVLDLTPVFTILNAESVWRRKAVNRVLFHLGLPVAKLAAQIAFRKAAIRIPSRIAVGKVSRFGDAFNDLWERVSKDYTVAIIRNKEYLNWRYVDNPYAYVTYAAKDGKALLGYVVMKTETAPSGLKHGFLVDVLAVREPPDTLQILLAKAMEHFQREHADVVSTWVVKSSQWYKLLRKWRFIARRQKLHFVIRANPMGPTRQMQLKDPANWYFTMGDTDGI